MFDKKEDRSVKARDNLGTIITGDGNTLNLTSSHSTPSQLTSTLGTHSTIIGRKKELKKIDNLMKINDSLLLINGIGGVGKSHISSYYLYSHKENFDYYGFFEGLDTFMVELKEPLNLKSENPDEAFIEALAKLRKLEGNKLLVLDNVEKIEENQEYINKILDLKDSGYKILITSREEVDNKNIKPYYLDILSLEDAKELFNSIHKVEDETLLEEILEYLDYHAFFIEKTALSIKKTLTPQIIRDKFNNGAFSKISVKRKHNFNKFLNELFTLDRLDEDETLMLKQFSTLPSVKIDFNFLESIFQKKEDNKFEELLDFLSEKGWLSKLEEGYKLHKIIKEYIVINHAPSFKEIEIIFLYFDELIRNDVTIQHILDRQKYLIYLNSFSEVLSKNYDKTESIAFFFNQIGYVNAFFFYNKKAKKVYKISLAIRKEVLDSNDIRIAISINNLASVYENLEDYEKSLNLYLESLKIRKYFDEKSEKVAIAYNNVGRVYAYLKKFEIAIEYLKKSLELRTNIFGINHEYTARAYNVLGSTLHDIAKSEQDYDEVFKLLKTSLDIRNKVLLPNHPDIANSYANLSCYFFDIEEYIKSYDYIQKAINIYEGSLPKNHPHLIKAKERLDKVKLKLIGNDRRVTVTENNDGIIITGDNNTVIKSAPHIIPKVLTNQTGLANDIDFVGRKKELQKVDELLNQNSMLLLLNGIGGIGKSTLASYYLNQRKDDFDYYGFVQVNEDIKLSLASAFSTSLDLKSEKIDDLFAEIMNKLQNLEGKKLLIIDDVKEMDNQLDEMNTLMTLKNNGFQILFTSRETKEYIPQYFLDIMTVEDARELFLKHYSTDEMDKVDKILEYLDYHTLFIEITAKTLTKRRDTLSLNEVIEKFENGEFTAVKRNKSESFNKFLKNFSYDSNILTQKKNILFLKKISVLPSIEISFEDLYRFLVCEDKEVLQDFVIELIDNGWLIKLDNGYKFHQILKEFIFDDYAPSYEEIEEIIDNFSNSYLVLKMINTIVFQKQSKKLLFAQSLVKYFKLKLIDTNNANIANTFMLVGMISDAIGNNFNNTMLLYKEAISIKEKVDPFNVSSTRDHLAELFLSESRYDEALKIYFQSIKFYKKYPNSNTFHTNMMNNYSSIGLIYGLQSKYEEALNMHNFILQNDIEKYGQDHDYTASTLNNIALTYSEMDNHSEAIKFYEYSVKIREKILPWNHQHLSITYHNLHLSLLESKTFITSYYYLVKSIKIKDDIFSEQHRDYINGYNSILNFYMKLLKYERKNTFILNKCVIISKEFLNENHFIVNINYLLLSQFSDKREDKIYYYKKSDIFFKNFFDLSKKSIIKESELKKLLFKTWSKIFKYSIN